MLTVRTLATETALELVAGDEAADAPVRWVHITELLDPTPWLSGGELILTTGLQLHGGERQREFVRRLADHHLAGLGFGTGFDHPSVPGPILEEAKGLGFPVFEVPHETPFIAITELAFTRLVNEQYEVLQRGIAIHKRLERLVLEERGLDELVRALAATIGGAVLVLDARGETMASRAFRRELARESVAAVRAEIDARGEYHEFAPDHPSVAGRSLALPVAARGSGPPQAWLVAANDAGGMGEFERLILQQGATVVALELMRQRTMRETERRLAGDVLAEAVNGDLDAREIELRLGPFGVRDQATVIVFGPDPPAEGEADLERFMGDAGVGALVATREGLLCAVVDSQQDTDPVELAGRAREAVAPYTRAAASRVGPVGSLRRSFHEARCALEATALGNGSAPSVASHRDLGVFQLLLSLQDDEALRLYCDSVLGPLEGDGRAQGGPARSAPRGYGDELIRSLEAFIEHNGQWEKAARALFCHRHTLRYRIRRVEALTGRDLKTARDRIELWLALRARELVA